MSERRDRSFNENLDKVRKLAPEQRTPELLIGRSVVEVISVLPTFCWHMEDGAYRFGKLGISELRAINYRTFRKDCFEPSSAIPTIPGLPLEMERLSPLLSSPENWTAALISLVGLDEYRKGMENDSAHIPLIDIDSDLPLDKLVPLVREEMKKTEISDGVILASSDPRTGNINRERGAYPCYRD